MWRTDMGQRELAMLYHRQLKDDPKREARRIKAHQRGFQDWRSSRNRLRMPQAYHRIDMILEQGCVCTRAFNQIGILKHQQSLCRYLYRHQFFPILGEAYQKQED